MDLPAFSLVWWLGIGSIYISMKLYEVLGWVFAVYALVLSMVDFIMGV